MSSHETARDIPRKDSGSQTPVSHSAPRPIEKKIFIEKKPPLVVPGHGLPLTGRQRDMFPNALFLEDNRNVEAPLLTAREYTMMKIMNTLSDKTDWQTKIFDDKIAAKWKTEILTQSDYDVSVKMFDESLAELKFRAQFAQQTDFFEALDGVFKSDTIISEDIREALVREVKRLEDVPEDQKDWHPGSDGKVLDLVHPSLYPLVYGQTRILPVEATTSVDDWRSQFGLGQKSNGDHDDIEGVRSEWSKKYQWLPCEVDVSESQARIASYINNLQPDKHRKLYGVIEQIIGRTLPLWEETLSNVSNRDKRSPRITMVGDGYGSVAETMPEKDDEEGWDEYSVRSSAWMESRPIVQPEPKPFKPFDIGEQSRANIRRDWGHPNRRLQVIVKLASIHLTPESPDYDGGTWHVEGAANENICASAIYYYESENITASHLTFRQLVADETMDLNYDQDDHRAVETIYGFENNQTLIQNLGSVLTRQGRLLAFPNAMQHCVAPFSLADNTKPGFRKILALFLVDPHQRIVSTAHVPPQQREWWREHMQLTDTILGRLPQELSDKIRVHFPDEVAEEDAKRWRDELMKERKVFTWKRTENLEDVGTFSLCEH